MPKKRAASAAVFLLAGWGAIPHSASQPAEQPKPAYTAAATAVVVDVIARDRTGRPVTDLEARDFELYEDDVLQKLETFNRVSRGSGIGVGVAWKPPTSTTAVSLSPAGTPTQDIEADGATAIVFDHLTAESLRLAQQATLAYVPLAGALPGRIAVFATEPGVRLLQAYTTDPTLIRRAVARLVPYGSSAQETQAERREELLGRRRQLGLETEAAAAGGAVGSGEVLSTNASELGNRENERRLVQTELNMLRAFENLDREQKGFDTSLALLTTIRSLAEYPGRKAVVFFSEGLPVSPALSAKLDAVIDAAGRANVTAYAVDAKGLRGTGATATLLKEVMAHADERLAQVSSGGNRTNEPLTVAFERIEDTLKLDSRTGLARLAEETGGFLVEQSNDLASAFRRIEEDSRFQYRLTYSPRNTAFDGKFRSIRVKVRRPSTQVFARRGYRALRAPAGVTAANDEAPALAVLDGGRLPNDFPVHTGAFSFPETGRPGLTPVLVHVSTSNLEFAVDRRASTYSGQAIVLVRVKGSAATQTLSQQYLLSGDARDLEAARRGEIIFYRELDLEPGVYTVESVVFDAATRQASARVTTLNVLGRHRSEGMSSLVLVNRIEDTTDAEPAAGRAPLYVGRTLLYPNLGQPISKASTGELPFYFTLYNIAEPAVSAQLLRNGRPVAVASVALPPGGGPRVQHVGKLPITALPSGIYELRIVVRTASQELSRTAFFTLVD
jgi:VWFA-related protein